jgi:hypothetical protein
MALKKTDIKPASPWLPWLLWPDDIVVAASAVTPLVMWSAPCLGAIIVRDYSWRLVFFVEETDFGLTPRSGYRRSYSKKSKKSKQDATSGGRAKREKRESNKQTATANNLTIHKGRRITYHYSYNSPDLP